MFSSWFALEHNSISDIWSYNNDSCCDRGYTVIALQRALARRLPIP